MLLRRARMISLRDLQSRILDALLGGTGQDRESVTGSSQPEQPALSLIADSPSAAAARLSVSRNTALSHIAGALHDTFPAVWRLVGEEYFLDAAREYVRLHPSRSGDLRHVGDRFPAYLASLFGTDRYQVVAEVARLEWLIQDVLLAAPHRSLDLTALAAVEPAAYGSLHFVLHPALRLFESPYPAQRIWESNVMCEAEPEVIDVRSGPDRLAILPYRSQLRFVRLSRGDWALLNAIAAGETWAASVAAAMQSDEEFDASVALRRFVELAAIVDCR